MTMIASVQSSETALNKLRQNTLTADELLNLLKQYNLMPLLLRELLIDDAIASITLSHQDYLDACAQFYQQQHLTTDVDRQTWLEAHQLSSPQLDRLITRSLRLTKFKQARWGHKLASYFLQRKTQLDRVIYSLLRVKEVSVAQELFFRIQEGERTFAALARQYSQGAEARTGGLIGPMELSKPHPVLAKMLAVSQAGQLLPPTRLNGWVVIVRLEQLLEAQMDEAMQERLLTELFEQWVQEQIEP